MIMKMIDDDNDDDNDDDEGTFTCNLSSCSSMHSSSPSTANRPQSVMVRVLRFVQQSKPCILHAAQELRQTLTIW